MKSHRSFVAAVLVTFCLQVLGQDPEIGTMKWEAPAVAKARLTSPALDEENGIIYAGGSDGRLYAFDAETGEAYYDPAFRVGVGQCSVPLIGPDGTVYLALADGLVAVTNMVDNPGVKWRYRVERPLVGSPAMDTNGILYIGSRDNRLHAVFSARGNRKWSFDAGSDVTTSPTITPNGDIVFVAGGAVYTVDENGSQVSLFRAGTPVRAIPVANEDGNIYFGANNNFIYAVNGDSGTTTNGGNNTEGVVWRIPAGANVQSAPALGVDGSLYIGTDNRRVLCIDTNGGIVWRFPTRGPVRGGVSLGADGTVYVGTDAHTLHAITPAGAEKWQFRDFRGQLRGSPIIDRDGTVYFTAGRSLYAIVDPVLAEESPWPQYRRDAERSARATGGTPFILQQPQSMSVTNGQRVEFTVVASAGAPVQYQWMFNGVDIDPEDNPTATNATLVLESATPSDAGLYEVLVYNDYDEVISDPAELFVEAPPQIVTDLTNRLVSVGTTVRLELGAVGLGQLTYQWHLNGVDIPGATNSFFVITNAQIGNSGAYDAVVSNVYGSSQSRTSILSVVELVLTRATNVVAAGNRFTAAIVTNQLFTWGVDTNGQLGDGGFTTRNVPTRTSTNVDWLSVSAGGRGNTNSAGHGLALRIDGTLYVWGANGRGQLGIGGGTNDQRTPARVSGNADWVQVEAGALHSVGLRTNGTIWTWGDNQYGQLGIGGSNNMVFPTQVGFDTAWTEVRAGGSFTLARRADGTIWAWGRNESGQLGIGSTNNASAPVQIGTNTDWVAISAGNSHSLGIRADGTLWVWGRNFGLTTVRINEPTNTFRVPTQVGGASNWVAADAGFDHSLAINSAGQLFAFGANNIGQLGNGLSGQTSGSTNLANLANPAEIGAGKTWARADAGVKHSIAMATDGTIWAWGWNNLGQVGDGTGGDGSELSNRKTPVQLVFTNFATVNTNTPGSGVPLITQQPASTNVQQGQTATFAAAVSSTTPVTLLWYFNATNGLALQTNLTLVLPNVQPAVTGRYSVVVSNTFGVVTSSFATLTITTNTSTNVTITPGSAPMTAPMIATGAVGGEASLIIVPPTRAAGTVLVPAISGEQGTLVLEFKDRLSDPEWTAISTNAAGPGRIQLTDPSPSDTSRFYRVRRQK